MRTRVTANVSKRLFAIPWPPVPSYTGTSWSSSARGRPRMTSPSRGTEGPRRAGRGSPVSSWAALLRAGFLHDLPAGEHEAEDEKDRDGARVHEDLDEEDELRAEEEVDPTDRHEGHREPERGADEAAVRDDEDRAD